MLRFAQHDKHRKDEAPLPAPRATMKVAPTGADGLFAFWV